MVLDPQELTTNFVDNMKYSSKRVKFIDEKALECYDRLIKEWVINEIDKAIKGQKIDKVIKEQNKFQVILGGFD